MHTAAGLACSVLPYPLCRVHAAAAKHALQSASHAPCLQYAGFTLPLAYGRGILGLRVGPLPEREPLATVIGAPVPLPPFKGGPVGPGVGMWGRWEPGACSHHTIANDAMPCTPTAASILHPAGDLRSEKGSAHVDACHALYCEALRRLYDEHKDKYAPNRKRDMRFVE